MTVDEKLENKLQREVNKAFGVPDVLTGIPTPWWRRVWQKWTRRP